MPGKHLRRHAAAGAGLLVSLNAQKALEGAGADAWLSTALTRLPQWSAPLVEFAQNRIVIIVAAVYLGVVLRDWSIGLHGRITLRHGRPPLRWIRGRMHLALHAAQGGRLGRRINASRNLTDLERELTSGGIGMPPLPCTDAADPAGTARTVEYLRVTLPFMRDGRLDWARRLADAVHRGLL